MCVLKKNTYGRVFLIHKTQLDTVNQLKQSVDLALSDTKKECYDRDWRSVELNNQVAVSRFGDMVISMGRESCLQAIYYCNDRCVRKGIHKKYNPPELSGGNFAQTSAEAEEHII